MLKNLSDNLNILMAKARINSSELARLTGLPATTIKRIRNNEQSNPTISTLLPIAKYFSLTISELLNDETIHIENNFSNQLGLRTIPLLSWRECVHFHLLDYTKCINKMFTEKPVSDKSYCLIVEDSDLDFFPEQCHLIVDPGIIPELGDYVIAAKSEQGTASIKKYIVETDQVYLKSLVDGLGITPLTSEYKILGVIIQYKKELKNKL